MQKYHLSNPTSFNILKDDQDFILSVLDGPIGGAATEPSMGLLLTISKFGQKTTDPLVVTTLVDRGSLNRASVHVAFNLTPVVKEWAAETRWTEWTAISSTEHGRGSQLPKLAGRQHPWCRFIRGVEVSAVVWWRGKQHPAWWLNHFRPSIC